MPTATATSNLASGRVQIALIGCNHRTAPVELRERIAFTPEQALRATDELRSSGSLEEAVVLSTCNRSELYGVAASPDGDVQSEMEKLLTDFHGLAPTELNGRLYRENNVEAVRHLYRVASGLDYRMYDADNHLYEVADAFTRHLPKRREQDFYWTTDGRGHRHIVLGGKVFDFLPNPTFDPIAVITGHKRSGSLQHRRARLIPTRSLLQRILGDFRPACLPLSSSGASWRELLSEYWVNSSHNRSEGDNNHDCAKHQCSISGPNHRPPTRSTTHQSASSGPLV